MEATAQVIPIKKKASLADVLKSARTTETTKKSSTPLLKVGEDTAQLAQEVKELKTEVESLKSALDIKEMELVDLIRPLRAEYIKNREFTSSVKIPTTDNLTLMITWAEKYIKCPPANEEGIVNLIGQERYDNYFSVMNTITVRDMPEEKLEELIERVGAENFAEYFSVETNIKPNERFKLDKYRVFSDDELDELELVGIKQYKASVKK